MSITIQPADYVSHHAVALVEQYKVLVESAERVSVRRQAANTINISFNTLLLAAYALVGQTAPSNAERRPLDAWHALVLIVGVAGCLNWWTQIKSYRALNAAKFEIIHEIERRLPARVFYDEWELLKRNKYAQLTNVESLIPGIFGVLYVAMTVFLMVRR